MFRITSCGEAKNSLKTGIQKSFKFLDSGSRWLSPACLE